MTPTTGEQCGPGSPISMTAANPLRIGDRPDVDPDNLDRHHSRVPVRPAGKEDRSDPYVCRPRVAYRSAVPSHDTSGAAPPFCRQRQRGQYDADRTQAPARPGPSRPGQPAQTAATRQMMRCRM